jgi:hypothetical protein
LKVRHTNKKGGGIKESAQYWGKELLDTWNDATGKIKQNSIEVKAAQQFGQAVGVLKPPPPLPPPAPPSSPPSAASDITPVSLTETGETRSLPESPSPVPPSESSPTPTPSTFLQEVQSTFHDAIYNNPTMNLVKPGADVISQKVEDAAEATVEAASQLVEKVKTTVVWYEDAAVSLFNDSVSYLTASITNIAQLLNKRSTWVGIGFLCLLFCFLSGAVSITWFTTHLGAILRLLQKTTAYVGPILKRFFEFIYKRRAYLEFLLIRMLFWAQETFYCKDSGKTQTREECQQAMSSHCKMIVDLDETLSITRFVHMIYKIFTRVLKFVYTGWKGSAERMVVFLKYIYGSFGRINDEVENLQNKNKYSYKSAFLKDAATRRPPLDPLAFRDVAMVQQDPELPPIMVSLRGLYKVGDKLHPLRPLDGDKYDYDQQTWVDDSKDFEEEYTIETTVDAADRNVVIQSRKNLVKTPEGVDLFQHMLSDAVDDKNDVLMPVLQQNGDDESDPFESIAEALEKSDQ